MLLTDVGKHLLVVPARVFLLSFAKGYVVGDAAISSVSLRILLSHVERHTNRERCNTALSGFQVGSAAIESPAAIANARIRRIFI
jgi:hypothetical protein